MEWSCSVLGLTVLLGHSYTHTHTHTRARTYSGRQNCTHTHTNWHTHECVQTHIHTLREEARWAHLWPTAISYRPGVEVFQCVCVCVCVRVCGSVFLHNYIALKTLLLDWKATLRLENVFDILYTICTLKHGLQSPCIALLLYSVLWRC